MLKDPSKANIRKAWNATYNVNTTSTQVMTWTFIPLLLESKNPRLIFVTSGIASLTFSSSGRSSVVSKQPPKGWPKPTDFSGVAYRASKAGLNLLMIDWTRVLKEDGVKVFGIAPGMLATGFAGMGADAMRAIGAMEPSVGGVFIKDVVAGKRDEDAGKVINKDGITAW
jgi:NAD(P)-dependent dehydrogenase (short-subunit alcohol dehydrogenase family)